MGKQKGEVAYEFAEGGGKGDNIACLVRLVKKTKKKNPPLAFFPKLLA